jgi:hypothetical protein
LSIFKRIEWLKLISATVIMGVAVFIANDMLSLHTSILIGGVQLALTALGGIVIYGLSLLIMKSEVSTQILSMEKGILNKRKTSFAHRLS